MPKRYPPDDPREWLNRARSNLVRARAKRKGIYVEDLCFDAQQAAEKAIKAILIKLNVNFPYVHDLAELLTLVEKAGQEVPESIRQAERLSKFAVFTRYPGIGPSIKERNTGRPLRLQRGSLSGRKYYLAQAAEISMSVSLASEMRPSG